MIDEATATLNDITLDTNNKDQYINKEKEEGQQQQQQSSTTTAVSAKHKEETNTAIKEEEDKQDKELENSEEANQSSPRQVEQQQTNLSADRITTSLSSSDTQKPQPTEQHPLQKDSSVSSLGSSNTKITSEVTNSSPVGERSLCRKHRLAYIQTQLGGSNSSNMSLEQLLNEESQESGMGYKHPGPQGFLYYTDSNHEQQHLQQQQQQPQFKVPTSTTTTTTTTTPIGHHSTKSAGKMSSGNLRSSTSMANIGTTRGGTIGPSAGAGLSSSSSTLKEDTKRKSLRMSRMQKNEEDRRKRKEQKRARAREKPIYVSTMEELPPECIKMIRKSKIPDEKIKEHFDILLPILRFRTGFNLKSANPTPKSKSTNNLADGVSSTTSSQQSQQAISPEIMVGASGNSIINNNNSSTQSLEQNGHRKSLSGGRGASLSYGVTQGTQNDLQEDSDGDGSRLEQSIVPKGTTDLFEKGDVKKLYKNLKQIGSGGFGSVYLAKSTVDKCEIAIKKIAHATPKAQRTNLNEIGYLHFCNHPNIVRYLRSHLVDDQVWIAMEYMQGGTLTEACSNHSFNESCIAYVAKGMLEGLVYLHANDLVHRDIKSGNIMMTIDGKIKIVDFGLCVDTTQRKLTHMAGSPFWMSPEMIRGEGYGCPSDIWSFAICLLELANGEPPNRKSSLNAMFTIATQGCSGLDRTEKWSEGFKNFLSLCLETDPSKRATAQQLLSHPWLTISENPETMKKILAQIFIANVMNHLDPI